MINLIFKPSVPAVAGPSPLKGATFFDKYFRSPFLPPKAGRQGDVRRTGGFKSAQGVVESVFAVGILAMLMGGAVILVIMGIDNRRMGFDRRKAVELVTVLTEELIAKSQDNPEQFWTYENDGVGLSKNEFEGYTYTIGYTNISGDADYPNCGESGKINCAEVTIGVGWSGKNPQSLSVSRFFSKK